MCRPSNSQRVARPKKIAIKTRRARIERGARHERLALEDVDDIEEGAAEDDAAHAQTPSLACDRKCRLVALVALGGTAAGCLGTAALLVLLGGGGYGLGRASSPTTPPPLEPPPAAPPPAKPFPAPTPPASPPAVPPPQPSSPPPPRAVPPHSQPPPYLTWHGGLSSEQCDAMFADPAGLLREMWAEEASTNWGPNTGKPPCWGGDPSGFFAGVLQGMGCNKNWYEGTKGPCLLYTSPSPRDS